MNFHLARIGIISFILFLAACQSIGTPYVPPDETQDSALFVGGGSYINQFVYINQFDEEGCYSGRTIIREDIRVHAEKELFLAAEKLFRLSDWQMSCTVNFSLVPKKDEKYKVLSSRSGLLCSAGVVRINDDGSAIPVPVKGLTPSKKGLLACIKMVPSKRTNK
ncbi:MAG: hypothetical protein LBU11_07925 [Zoogloeaceae bacterium]|jgi:hypothetical protein|nr:hypothetical protein [Zoogloeaceae bacterium]